MPNAISERALFARVARKIAHDGLSLHRCRYDARSFRDTGRYSLVMLQATLMLALFNWSSGAES